MFTALNALSRSNDFHLSKTRNFRLLTEEMYHKKQIVQSGQQNTAAGVKIKKTEEKRG
jgi:hypothetical protein